MRVRGELDNGLKMKVCEEDGEKKMSFCYGKWMQMSGVDEIK